MNWYKKAQQNKFLGYKIVGKDSQTGTVYSIYNKQPFTMHIGIPLEYRGEGLFLGTSEQFCMDYYSCSTKEEDQELLLTYEYFLDDLIKGDPSCSNGEVQVSKSILINIKEINKEEI